MKRTLDWIPQWDEKNELFTVAGLDCFVSGKERPRVRRKKKVFLDQGQEGACAGFGLTHVLAAAPLPIPDLTDAFAHDLYKHAQRHDEIEGEAYSGTTINGVMKASSDRALITEWRWCKTLAEARHALSYHGPLVIGVNWYEGMYEPDADGFIHVTGAVIGGHAIMLAGYKTLLDGSRVYRFENSWGVEWGDAGGCWITESDLERLLQERGEFACPKKTPL